MKNTELMTAGSAGGQAQAETSGVFGSLGLTLLELLVVTGIVSLLAMALLPAVQTARDQTRDTACMVNLRRIALATQVYAGDNNGRTPDFRGYDSRYGFAAWYPSPEYGGMPGPVGLGLLVADYLPDGHAYYCPMQTHMYCIYQGICGWKEWGNTGYLTTPGYEDQLAAVVVGYFTRQSQDMAWGPRAISADMWYAWFHRTAHEDGFSVCYTDGTVKWLPREDIWWWDRFLAGIGEIEETWEDLDDAY